MTPFRVLICGGRDYADWLKVYTALDALLEEHGSLTVIQGGAKGTDALARAWYAKRVKRGRHVLLEMIEVPADWAKHGKAAGPVRNQAMIEYHKPQLVLAFPGGRGTADIVGKAREAGVEVREIEP